MSAENPGLGRHFLLSAGSNVLGLPEFALLPHAISHHCPPRLQGWRVRMDMYRTELKNAPAEEPVLLQPGRLMTSLKFPKMNAALS